MIEQGSRTLRGLFETQNPILRNSLTSMSLRVFGLLLAFGSQVLLSNMLGAAQYGSYVIALGWAMVLTIPARVGLDNAALRFATIYREQEEYSKLHGLIRFSLLVMLAVSALMAALLLAAKATGLPPLRRIDSLLIAAVACLILPQAVLGWLSALVRAANRIFAAQFYEQVLRPSMLIVALCIFWMTGPLDAGAAMLLTAAMVAIAALCVGWQAARIFRTARAEVPSYEDRRTWLSVGWVLFLMAAVQELLNQINVILLGLLANATAAAHFAAAWRLSSLVAFGLVAITTVCGPLIASAHNRDDRPELARIARLNARVSTAFALAAVFVLILVGRPALGLFGPGFSEAYPTMLILLIGGLANAFTGSAGYFLALTGHHKSALVILSGALVVNILVSFALIPGLGSTGSAIGSTSASILWNIAMVFHVRRLIGVDPTPIASRLVR